MQELSEAELATAICGRAIALGYVIARFPSSNVRRDKNGEAIYGKLKYKTKGYPDYSFFKDRHFVAELKKEGGKLSVEQKYWRDVLEKAGVEYHLWFPHHWFDGTVDTVLTAGARASG